MAELEVLVEIEVYIPPKKVRALNGRLVHKGRAKFETAFGDELIKVPAKKEGQPPT